MLRIGPVRDFALGHVGRGHAASVLALQLALHPDAPPPASPPITASRPRACIDKLDKRIAVEAAVNDAITH